MKVMRQHLTEDAQREVQGFEVGWERGGWSGRRGTGLGRKRNFLYLQKSFPHLVWWVIIHNESKLRIT